MIMRHFYNQKKSAIKTVSILKEGDKLNEAQNGTSRRPLSSGLAGDKPEGPFTAPGQAVTPSSLRLHTNPLPHLSPKIKPTQKNRTPCSRPGAVKQKRNRAQAAVGHRTETP